METVSYERLYFDTNHNGDLTDDPVTESRSSRNLSISYVNTVFPSVGLTIETDGVKLEYAFTMSVYSNATTQYSYANASLSAAAYREGEMAIDGKKYRVVVVDYNSNGRFDDQAGIDENVRLSDDTVYPSVGDMLYLIDPDVKPDRSANPYDATSNDAMYYVAKQVNLGGRFLDLKITPAGDELTLEPSLDSGRLRDQREPRLSGDRVRRAGILEGCRRRVGQSALAGGPMEARFLYHRQDRRGRASEGRGPGDRVAV